jgi:hypothetical protein
MPASVCQRVCETSGMPDSSFDQAGLSATLRAQENVVSRPQAFAHGMTRSSLAHRIRPGGPWQRLLAGVYLAQTGPANVAQKDMAALLHAGCGSVLTGPAALHGLGITDAEPARFDVLVPNSRRPKSTAFITIHRTTRMPERVVSEGRRRYALAPRALVDTARGMTSLREVRGLIVGAVQRGTVRSRRWSASCQEIGCGTPRCCGRHWPRWPRGSVRFWGPHQRGPAAGADVQRPPAATGCPLALTGFRSDPD